MGDNLVVHPLRLRNLRACLSCKLIKTAQQWQDGTCENCGDIADVSTDTTPLFKGVLALMQPDARSWVARYTMTVNKVKGLYAMTVVKGTADHDAEDTYTGEAADDLNNFIASDKDAQSMSD